MDDLVSACSVRGETVHARRSGTRIALCGAQNVSPLDEVWDADSAYACHHCLRYLARQGDPIPAVNRRGSVDTSGT